MRLLVFLFALLSASVSFANLTPAQARLSQLLNHFTTYQADFSQRTYSEQQQLMQEGEGAVALSRPGKFRWVTRKPTNQIIIANGNVLWIYDVDLMQATQKPITSAMGQTPVALLSGQVDQVLSSFHISQSRPDEFTLLPKQAKQSGFEKLILSFSNERLVRLTLVNSLNQTSIFSFTHIKLNTPLAASLFQFTLPKGVEVLTQSNTP